MIDREIVREALAVLCNAEVSVINGGYGSSWPFSMKRHSLFDLDDDFESLDLVDGGSERAKLFSIDHLIPRVLQADRRSLFEDKIYSERNQRVRRPGVCQGVSTDETTGEIKLKIAIDQQRFFHPQHDYDFTNRKDTVTFWRGGEKYKRPCGYKRFGLKVLGEYEDDTWLGRRGRGTRSVKGEWPVSYHGTKAKLVDGIITGTYKAGRRQRCGRGVYSTPHISVAERERYAKTFTSKKDGKDYKVILQNRINPKYRVICEKEPKYWLIRIPEGTSEEDEKELVKRAIRPYGLLIKEVKEIP